MTVETTVRKETFAGGQANLTFTFKCLVTSPQDIKVTATSGGVDTILAYGIDYTVTPGDDGVGGVVTLSPTYSTGYTHTVYRETTNKQESDYNDFNQFPADTLETDLDRRTLVDQEQSEDLGRSLRLPISSTISNLTLPSPDPGKALKWNPAGDGLINTNDDIDVYIAAAANYASSASTQAAAALVSANQAATSATTSGNYATTASTQATDAANAASTASTQAATASTQAAEAAKYASTASTQAQTASTQAVEASKYASTASTQAGNAANSATTASTQATLAGNYAQTASTQAQTASTQASAAATSATAASNSATLAGLYAQTASGNQIPSQGGQDYKFLMTSNNTLAWNFVPGSSLVSLATIAAAAGVIPVANLGTGTTDSTTFLRGDGQFAVPPTSGSANVGMIITTFSATNIPVFSTSALAAGKTHRIYITAGHTSTFYIAGLTIGNLNTITFVPATSASYLSLIIETTKPAQDTGASGHIVTYVLSPLNTATPILPSSATLGSYNDGGGLGGGGFVRMKFLGGTPSTINITDIAYD